MSQKPPLPKNWFIETDCGKYVVRGTPAGMLLSDALNDPSLYDYNTATKVADELAGMLAIHGVLIKLVAKSKNP